MKNIEHYKAKIEAELKDVEAELASVGRKNPSNPRDWEATPPHADTVAADRNEVADSIEEFEENTGILKELEIRYNDLKAALERIEKGAYGRCEVCRKEIEDARLEANLAATTCREHM